MNFSLAIGREHRQWLAAGDDGETEDMRETAALGKLLVFAAKGGEDDLVTVLEATAHREPDGVGDLGRDRNGQRGEVVFAGIPGSMREAAEERQHVGGIDAAEHRHAELAIAGENPVRGPQRGHCADVNRLLAQELAPETELALPLQVQRLLVGATDQHHVPVELAERRGIQPHTAPRFRGQLAGR